MDKKKSQIKSSPKKIKEDEEISEEEEEEEENQVFEPEKEREKMRNILSTISVDDELDQHATASFESDEEKISNTKKETKKRKIHETKSSKKEESDEEIAIESNEVQVQQSDEEMQEVDDANASESEKEEEKTKQIQIKPKNKLQKEDTFRDYYVAEVTDAFGDDLDRIRKEDKDFTAKKLSVLVDCLESGVNIFSKEEKELYVNYLKKKEKK